MQLNGIVENALKTRVLSDKICLGVPKKQVFWHISSSLHITDVKLNAKSLEKPKKIKDSDSLIR